MLTLLECMKNNIPSNDSSKFKTTESHMDWEKVAFKDFSGDMCKLKWVEISNEVMDSPSLPNTFEHTSPPTLASTFLVGEMKQKSINRKERDQARCSCGCLCAFRELARLTALAKTSQFCYFLSYVVLNTYRLRASVT